MFNQRQKSIRNKPDAAPTANSNATTTTSASSPKSGLLSFNTSNFTKLFKNSTNFVQSTFGSGSTSTAQAQSQSPPSSLLLQSQAATHNSSSEITEQSFTIPSIKKRHDASNPCAPKKQRDILSTPVLIQPISMTNTSPLANLSSYKKIANDDSNNVVPKAYTMSNGSQKAHKQPSTGAVVTVTVSPSASASNQKPSTLSHARNSISSVINGADAAAASPTKQIDKVEKTSSTNVKLQNPQTLSDQNAVTTLSVQRSPAAKTTNANILFETVKMSKQNNTSTPSTSAASTAAATVKSCSISSNNLAEQYTNKNSSISSGNHIRSTIAKNDMNKNINNEQQCANEKPTTAAPIQNVVDNELIDGQHLDSNREMVNTTLSSNRSKAISMNVAPVISSTSKHFSTSIVPESTKSSSIVASSSVTTKQKYYKQINDNGLVDGAQAKNNNLLEIDVLNKDDVDIATDIVCNNNLEYNMDDYMHHLNNTNDNPFKLTANKFSAADLMAQIAENSKTVENIYANCVMMPMKSVNLDNYQQQQQQDTNENVVIESNEIDALGTIDAVDGPNNNYSNEHFSHTDNSNVCNDDNDDDLFKIDQLDISDDDGATETTQTTSTNDSTGKASQNILSSFNANCFAAKTNDLYDILEESDDDERHNLFRFNKWNSSSSLFVPKTSNANPISSSSFAAAIAFANEMNSTNHNPFLQLIANTPSNVQASTVAAATTTTTNESTIVNTSLHSQLFYERQKNSIGIAAPLISSAFNNNGQSDVCMAFTSMDKCLTSSTPSISNCATTDCWNDFAAMQAPLSLPTSLHNTHSFSQINGFIEQNDFQLNATPNSTTKNHISSDVMDTMLLFLKDHGNQYIKQFMQVI